MGVKSWTPLWSGPLGPDRDAFDRGPGVAVLELLRAEIAQGGMETSSVVDVVDEPWEVLCDIGEGFVGHRIDGFDLEGLHEALGLGVVVRVASAPHRTDETAAKQGFPIGLSCILRTAIRVVDTTGRRFAALDRGVESRQGQADVD